jgi:hypothetical protein
MTEFHPMLSLQLPITGADRFRVKAKPARQFSCAGQALSGSQIVAQNAQNDLSHQLFADADLAVMGKPELHAAIS